MTVVEKLDVGLIILGGQGHRNYFVNLCRILSAHDGRVVLFTSKQHRLDAESSIEVEEFEWVIKQDTDPTNKYLNRIKKDCEELDIVISFPLPGMRTVLSNLRFNPDCKMVQMIYNANLWSMTNLSPTIQLYKYAEPPLRRLLLSQMDSVLVEYSPIEQYLQNKVSVDVHSFTPIIFKNIYNSESSTFRITIPGHIDPARRNYSIFLDTLDKHLQDYKNKLDIQLLGCPAGSPGENIARRCDKLASAGWNITYYSEWIPVQEFEQKLKNSTIILSPMRSTKRVSAVTEKYGVSKASGCFGDAIQYGKPLILPNHYQAPHEVEPIIRQYETPLELKKVLLTTLREEGLTDEAIAHISGQYSVEQQRNRLYEIFTYIG